MSEPRLNRAQRVLAFMAGREGQWIGARDFEPVGGRQAWRTAISEARQIARAQGRDIVNRTRLVNGYTLSEYQLIPPRPVVQVTTTAEGQQGWSW